MKFGNLLVFIIFTLSCNSKAVLENRHDVIDSLTSKVEKVDTIGNEQFIDTASYIVHVDSLVNLIRDNILSYQKDTIGILGLSSEGSELVKYSQSDNLQTLKITHYGESGKAELIYYIESGQLIFVDRIDMLYQEPITMNTKIKIVDKKRNQYYFYNDELIRWINPFGGDITSTSTEFIRESEGINNLDELLDLIEEQP